MSTTYNSDGSINGIPNGINTLIAGATAGDIITIPDAPFTLGAGGAFINVTKAITLMGLGPSCVITISSGTHSSGLIQIYAAATVKDFSVIPVAGKYLFGILANGWSITNITYNQAYLTVAGRFAHINGGFGRIYLNDITCGAGTEETIYGQGPTDAWSTPYVPGTADSVIIERNVFRFPSAIGSQGYVCDANSNAMFTVRMNRIVGNQKVDGHGYNTNFSPTRGVRGMEVLGNLWTGTNGSNWQATEIRGGCSYQFWNNIVGSNAVLGYYRLDEYSVNAPGATNFSGIYQTPEDCPIPDQVGNGPGDVGSQVGGGQPSYFVNNYKGGSAASLRWDAVDAVTRTTSAGATAGATTVSMSGGSVRTGNSVAFLASGSTTYHEVTNGYTTSSGTATISPALTHDVPSGATVTYGPLAQYRRQTGNPAATFVIGPTQPCIIEANVDYFGTVAGFDGSAGCGSGTSGAMTLITPTTDGVGFWVNNEGSWNQSFSGTIAATAIEEWYWCEIVSVGTTNFTLIGAPANTVGICFLATGAGTGTGTVKPGQGQFYVADGGSWELDYTPYLYSLEGIPPTLLSASIGSLGTTLTLIFSESCTNGGNGGNGMTVTPSGGVATVSYSSGSGSNTYVYNINRTILSGETITLSYTQPGDGIESTATEMEVASFTDAAISNGSNISGGQASCLRNPASLGGGF